jgi:MFS family permease
MRLKRAGGLDREDVLSQAVILMFSVSLGMATVLIPLVAAAAGYSLTAVGFLVATSGVTQLLARMGMGVLMDRLATRTFVLAALILLLVSCVMLGLSDALVVFVISQLLQGAARAYFFTGAQTHVLRGSRRAVSALARMNVMNGVGLLIGPILAGVIGDVSLQGALLVAAGIAAVAIPVSLVLARHAPFARLVVDGDPTRPVWLRPGVTAAGWMGVSAGAWRGILNSYMPVLLTAAGHSIPVVGALTTVANLAALCGSSIAGIVYRMGIRALIVFATGLAIGGIAVVTFTTGSLWLAAVYLFVSGIGAGLLQTLGPTLATESVGLEDRGRSLAAVGTYRAASLLLVPMGIGALVLVLPSAALATAVVAVVVGLPTVLVRPGLRA